MIVDELGTIACLSRVASGGFYFPKENVKRRLALWLVHTVSNHFNQEQGGGDRIRRPTRLSQRQKYSGGNSAIYRRAPL
jgi:hypothetical protein